MSESGTFQVWIKAMRLRTLPLASAGIITGTAMALREGPVDWSIAGWALLTALSLQILSNLANDLGDFMKGTDNEERVGPQRAMQSGAISLSAMKIAVVITTMISLVSGVFTLHKSLDFFSSNPLLWVLLALGLAGIAAAIRYTIGKSAYGYSGLGDLAVFIFFGIAAVAGAYILQTKTFNWQVLMPAVSIGMFSVAVLNLNNMRDIENDEKSGKRTLVVKMGLENAKSYHGFLLLTGWLLVAIDWIMNYTIRVELLIFLPAIVFVRNIKHVLGTKDPRLLDPELKKIALGTLALSLLYLGLSYGKLHV